MLSVLWDVACERVTLGGALVLRQEAELLAQLRQSKDIILNVAFNQDNQTIVEHFIQEVFSASNYAFHIRYGAHGPADWPLLQDRVREEFSYFSFLRLTKLCSVHKAVPHLRWSEQIIEQAKSERTKFPEILIAVHLKYVPPYRVEESNANGSTWQAFFGRHAGNRRLGFLLLGDDDLPPDVRINGQVYQAKEIGIGLGVQLSLISMCEGFLGLASGICTAANFSDTPHVIFKHPRHHVQEMAKELGSSTQFSFASHRQRLLRTEVTGAVLDEALAFLLSQ